MASSPRPRGCPRQAVAVSRVVAGDRDGGSAFCGRSATACAPWAGPSSRPQAEGRCELALVPARRGPGHGYFSSLGMVSSRETAFPSTRRQSAQLMRIAFGVELPALFDADIPLRLSERQAGPPLEIHAERGVEQCLSPSRKRCGAAGLAARDRWPGAGGR
jgi:hypothetical protein